MLSFQKVLLFKCTIIILKFQHTVHNVAFTFLYEYIFFLGFQAQEQVHLCMYAMSPMQHLHLSPYLI